MKSRVPFFYSYKLFTGSSQASSLSEAHPVIPEEDPWCVHGWWGAWYKDLADQWDANGLAVDGELPSAALFRVCCKSMGKIYVVSSKEMRAWVARGGKMCPNPTGTLVYSLVLWREVKGRIFLLFPEEIPPALGRDPAQTGHSPEDAIPAMFTAACWDWEYFPVDVPSLKLRQHLFLGWKEGCSTEKQWGYVLWPRDYFPDVTGRCSGCVPQSKS